MITNVFVPIGASEQLFDYLITRPDGIIRILIANTDSPVQKLLSLVTQDTSLSMWVKDKISKGELVLAVSKGTSGLGNEFRVESEVV